MHLKFLLSCQNLIGRKLDIPKINFQDYYYYSSPKSLKDKPKSLDEIDPDILKTYEKLGIPLQEQKILSGVAG
jgi:Fe-S cluster assembly protein SufB